MSACCKISSLLACCLPKTVIPMLDEMRYSWPAIRKGWLVAASRSRATLYEFVSPQARDDIGLAYRSRQPPRSFQQEKIAGLVSEGIVQRLELIKIDKEQRRQVAGANGRCRGFAEAIE